MWEQLLFVGTIKYDDIICENNKKLCTHLVIHLNFIPFYILNRYMSSSIYSYEYYHSFIKNRRSVEVTVNIFDKRCCR